MSVCDINLISRLFYQLVHSYIFIHVSMIQYHTNLYNNMYTYIYIYIYIYIELYTNIE